MQTFVHTNSITLNLTAKRLILLMLLKILNRTLYSSVYNHTVDSDTAQCI